MSTCYKTSDNKYFGCPPKMSDGRHFTDYRPNCFLNGMVRDENKLTNSFSNLKVNNLGNGYIKCFWEISSIDNFRIDFSKSCFCAIRLYDITNNRNKNNSTCIMKEI